MSSRIWPPPNKDEQAVLDDTTLVPEEECESCECSPCICNWCGDCECDPCECDTCDMCGHLECECPECYVIYATQVIVTVDSDGDVSNVRVLSELDEPYDVEDDQGRSSATGKGSPYFERALRAAREQDWPNWDID